MSESGETLNREFSQVLHNVKRGASFYEVAFDFQAVYKVERRNQKWAKNWPGNQIFNQQNKERL